MSFFDTKSMQIYERSLDAASLRQKVLANNIANIDTPNFKRSDVSFDDVLLDYLNGASALPGMITNPRHIPIGVQSFSQIQPEIVVENSTTVNNNGNNVDVDSEMTQLAVNQIKYNLLVQELNGHLSRLRTAIQGGR
ncbi:flagellar basal body rod protein FlgB [Effusibacillus dendaii]|uniref:Flagellar basal body rod protein FlgB n=1 Tax=Effusibacillus dendaii TaxID=2743772 RepID=A0A7I8D595_9BACL|nr:flagellar basal body rod protein FlgB [Effusibacillus dendaii]BCJ85255.1 flagellar basal body rod protein FlgB [Effusibacillus dendaii]